VEILGVGWVEKASLVDESVGLLGAVLNPFGLRLKH